MIESFKILSLLLQYPDKELWAAKGEIEDLIAVNKDFTTEQKKMLQGFMIYVNQFETLADWQERYVELFDYSTKTGLYLFDLVYGSSRDRGQAMVDLRETYAQSGLIVAEDELPDYLPLFLEYVSCQPDMPHALRLLAEVRGVLVKMSEQFKNKEVPYLPVLEALVAFSSKK